MSALGYVSNIIGFVLLAAFSVWGMLAFLRDIYPSETPDEN